MSLAKTLGTLHQKGDNSNLVSLEDVVCGVVWTELNTN